MATKKIYILARWNLVSQETTMDKTTNIFIRKLVTKKNVLI